MRKLVRLFKKFFEQLNLSEKFKLAIDWKFDLKTYFCMRIDWFGESLDFSNLKELEAFDIWKTFPHKKLKKEEADLSYIWIEFYWGSKKKKPNENMEAR